MVEAVTNVLFLGSKITVNSDCSNEIRRWLLFDRKNTTNLDSVLKSKDIIFPTKICIVKTIIFPVVMYGYESQAIKKAEYWRMYAFELGAGKDSWESLG